LSEIERGGNLAIRKAQNEALIRIRSVGSLKLRKIHGRTVGFLTRVKRIHPCKKKLFLFSTSVEL